MSVQVTRLSSGLSVVTDDMPHLKTAALGVWVGSGSRDETTDEHGISHLLEHMAFKGTRRRTTREIAEAMRTGPGTMPVFDRRTFSDEQVNSIIAYVLDIRRIPEETKGYCYGKRINYVDKVFMHEDWSDLYDANMKLWKIVHLAKGPLKDPASGQTYAWGNYIEQYWDVQNDHSSHIFGADEHGHTVAINGMVPKRYDNVTKYSTPGGLMQIMK